MRTYACLLLTVFAATIVGHAQSPPQAPGRLHVRRVVLYKNGVGYFEHVGRVVGDQDVSISFTSAQLDDALKSLTALDLGNGQVTGVNYNSIAPLQQRLGGVGLNLGDIANVRTFFAALQGARLDVRTGVQAASGRLLSVEQANVDERRSVTVLSIIDQHGAVRSLEISPTSTVRLLDSDLADRVGQYLTALAAEHTRDERRVTIASRGTGERDLFVSYTSEVPAWKATYRLLMPDRTRRTPMLQGWAIVDNTVGEDWTNVELALVGGAPQSFVLRLSQPHYIRRPVVAPPAEAQSEPQRHTGAMVEGAGTLRGVARDPSGGLLPAVTVQLLDWHENVVDKTVTDDVGQYTFEPPRGRYRVRFELAGFVPVTSGAVDVMPGVIAQQDVRMAVGGLYESVTVTGESSAIDTSTSRTEIVERLAAIAPAAQARDVGDLFEYRIKEPVTVRKNQSALVPILQASVTAERVSIWNDALKRSRPLRAVWMTNTSHLTLDGGSFTVLDEGVFAGEGLLDPMKPGERRLLSYARDLGVAVDPSEDEDRERLARLRADGGFLVEHRETCGRRVYTIRNDDVTPRTMLVEHPARANWTLVGGVTPVETTATAHRFHVEMSPRSTATLVVNEVNIGESRHQTGQLTPERLDYYIRDLAIDASSARTLRAVLEKRGAAAGVARERASREQETARIREEQKRLRENISALKGSTEEKRLLQRYVAQLDQQEDRLAALAREIEQFRGQERTATADFDETVKALVLDFSASAGASCAAR